MEVSKGLGYLSNVVPYFSGSGEESFFLYF